MSKTTINPEIGGRLPYQLCVIDTDTERFFHSRYYLHELPFVHAVCFVVRASETRLTAEQRIMLNGFLPIFGEDIKKNICTLVTFADAFDPPVLSTLKEAGLYFGEFFKFNNSSLFAENENKSNVPLPRVLWDMGFKSCSTFADHIEKLEKIQSSDKEALKEKQTLEAIMKDTQVQVVTFLSTASALTQKGYDIKDNPSLKKSFGCKVVTETFQTIIELPKGEVANHCISCKLTCFDASSESKYQHGAMNENGACNGCPRKCLRTNHYYSKYKFETVHVTRFEEISEQSNATAVQQIVKFDDSLINSMVNDLYDIVCSVITYDKKLKAITSASELDFHKKVGKQIDEMIAEEKQERKEGFLIRINILNDLLRRHESDLRKMQERELRTKYENDLQRKESKLRTKYENDLQRKESELRTKYENDLQRKESELRTKYENDLKRKEDELRLEYKNYLQRIESELLLHYENGLQRKERELRTKYESDLQRMESELRREHESDLQAKEREMKRRPLLSKLFD